VAQTENYIKQNKIKIEKHFFFFHLFFSLKK